MSPTTPPQAAADPRMADIPTVKSGFEQHRYICNDRIATTVYLAHHLQKPVLVEGPPGVGKTELALATARLLELPLVRLQCYEGLDESKALYEWKYGKQLLYTQMLREKLSEILDGAKDLKAGMARLHDFADVFFSEEFLEARPLLQALKEPTGAVLLIDEVDKSDYEFEAYLLEILSAYQITIPEIGTIRAGVPPIVFLTSNNTRELGDALKRRCLHLYIPFPDAKIESRIVEAQVPGLSESLRKQLVAFVHALREADLKKLPAISETVDWARTLVLLNATELDADLVRSTLNVLLKFQEDAETVDPELHALTRAAKQAV
ncbi:AAA family ATPase [Marinibaculum pumilum]|uniref:AAA family ATPase n=1 Tax=Marinibaculum pumilum TaxID=1766165 RepID=A0ABV7KWW5_9PROT